jgi:hypothetical protein
VGHADRVAGRHGVPAPDRRTHARTAAGARRQRAQTRDAAQPWAAWLALRGFLTLLVLAAATWSVLLLTQSRGGIWPIVALAAGALSLAMIALDVRARRRQRAAWRNRPSAADEWPEPGAVVAVDAVGGVEELAPVPPAEPGPVPSADPAPAPAPSMPPAPSTPPAPAPAPAPDPPSVPELPRRRSHRK